MTLAHFLEIVFAAPMVDAFWSSGTLFQIFAMLLVAKAGYPGTGGWISFEFTDLVVLTHSFSLNKRQPNGSIFCFDFHTVTAVIEATASFRLWRLAFFSTSLE